MINELEEPRWRELAAAAELAGRPLTFLSLTDSTNRVALELAGQGAGVAVVVAERQSGGRGRLRRGWHSPPGAGIYCSILYRPRLAPQDLPKLTLAAGLAVAVAVEKTTGLQPGLKWPNDLLLAGKKCGGILCECCLDGGGESRIEGGGRPAVVVGIGLNVNTTAARIPAALQERATSLRLVGGRSWDRGLLLAAMVEELDALLAELEQGRFPVILAAWRQRDALLGRELDWLTPAGKVVRGTALGPDPDGMLRIRDGRGRVHEVMSGDLSLADQP